MARIITEPICKTGERTLVPWRHRHKNKKTQAVNVSRNIQQSDRICLNNDNLIILVWSFKLLIFVEKTFLTNCEHIMFIQLRTIIFSNYCHYMLIHPSITRHQTPESSVDCYQPICKKTAFTDVSGRCLSDMCHQFLRSHIHELLARDIPAAICV